MAMVMMKKFNQPYSEIQEMPIEDILAFILIEEARTNYQKKEEQKEADRLKKLIKQQKI